MRNRLFDGWLSAERLLALPDGRLTLLTRARTHTHTKHTESYKPCYPSAVARSHHHGFVFAGPGGSPAFTRSFTHSRLALPCHSLKGVYNLKVVCIRACVQLMLMCGRACVCTFTRVRVRMRTYMCA